VPADVLEHAIADPVVGFQSKSSFGRLTLVAPKLTRGRVGFAQPRRAAASPNDDGQAAVTNSVNASWEVGGDLPLNGGQ
jgi:hypothetical protein